MAPRTTMPKPNGIFLTIFWLLTLGLGFLGGALARPYLSNLGVAKTQTRDLPETIAIKKQNPELDRFLKDFLKEEDNRLYITSKLIDENGISKKILPKLLEKIFADESNREEAVAFLMDEENQELDFFPTLMSQVWEDETTKASTAKVLAQDYQLYLIPPTEEDDPEMSELTVDALVELCPEKEAEESIEDYQDRIQSCNELPLIGVLRDRSSFYRPPFQLAYEKVLVSTPSTRAQPEEGQAYTCEDSPFDSTLFDRTEEELSPYLGKRVLLTSIKTDGIRTKELDVTQATFECPTSGSSFHLNAKDAIELFDILDEVNKVQIRIIDSML